jgi:hypothetical protein
MAVMGTGSERKQQIESDVQAENIAAAPFE